MKKYTALLILVVLAAACGGQPETLTVVETVVSEVEVTRLVEVTRAVVEEVEVTREVIVETEVEVTVVVSEEVEVTRLVEIEVPVTVTPSATPEATATAVPPAATAAPLPTATADRQTVLLTLMTITRAQVQSFGGMIDRAANEGFINCQEVVNVYDSIAQAPTLDVSGASQAVQGAYGAYRTAVETFADGAFDMTQNCRDFLANPSGGGIGFQQWGAARQNVDNAIDLLQPAIQALGGE